MFKAKITAGKFTDSIDALRALVDEAKFIMRLTARGKARSTRLGIFEAVKEAVHAGAGWKWVAGGGS